MCCNILRPNIWRASSASQEELSASLFPKEHHCTDIILQLHLYSASPRPKLCRVTGDVCSSHLSKAGTAMARRHTLGKQNCWARMGRAPLPHSLAKEAKTLLDSFITLSQKKASKPSRPRSRGGTRSPAPTRAQETQNSSFPGTTEPSPASPCSYGGDCDGEGSRPAPHHSGSHRSPQTLTGAP